MISDRGLAAAARYWEKPVESVTLLLNGLTRSDAKEWEALADIYDRLDVALPKDTFKMVVQGTNATRAMVIFIAEDLIEEFETLHYDDVRNLITGSPLLFSEVDIDTLESRGRF